MREIFQQYGAAVIGVVAAILFLALAGIYFNMENGELKKKHTEYLDTLSWEGNPQKGGSLVEEDSRAIWEHHSYRDCLPVPGIHIYVRVAE